MSPSLIGWGPGGNLLKSKAGRKRLLLSEFDGYEMVNPLTNQVDKYHLYFADMHISSEQFLFLILPSKPKDRHLNTSELHASNLRE